jgi:hypothetical protein
MGLLNQIMSDYEKSHLLKECPKCEKSINFSELACKHCGQGFDSEKVAQSTAQFEQYYSYLKSINSRIKMLNDEHYYITRNGKYWVGDKSFDDLDDVTQFIEENKGNKETLRLNFKLILETDWGNNPLPVDLVDKLISYE